MLIVAGPLLVWLKFGGTAGFTWWVWAKMVLVVLLPAVVIASGLTAKRAQGGDAASAQRLPILGLSGLALLVPIVLTAVFAFNLNRLRAPACKEPTIRASSGEFGMQPMKRARAIAIAREEQQAREARLLLTAGLLLLPALLLLLLISP